MIEVENGSSDLLEKVVNVKVDAHNEVRGRHIFVRRRSSISTRTRML